MTFTPSDLSGYCRVLSRGMVKETELSQASSAGFESPNVTHPCISHCCVLPVWGETLFLLCLLGSLPLPHHVQQALSIQLCSQTFP